jgi:hypothetical protein
LFEASILAAAEMAGQHRVDVWESLPEGGERQFHHDERECDDKQDQRC